MSEEQKPGDPGKGPDPERTEPMGRDWSRYQDPDHQARERDRMAHDAARDAERMARDQERMARDRERMERDRERAAREQQREREREERRAERHARREEWREERRTRRINVHGVDMSDFGFDPGDFAKNFMKDFVSDATGDSYTETANAEFLFDHMPRLRVRNLSGETKIRTGDGGKVTVVATKRVTASSEDRAKRLLQNLEIRMDKHGDELSIEPHLYEQERSWVDLFRGKRFRVDFDITVPPECAIDAQTVSGDLSVSGVRGPEEIQSVSGDVRVEDAQGPLRLKSVSGDVNIRRYVGHAEGNTVSGDVSLDAVRLRSLQFSSVSGDVSVKGVLESARAHRFKTISGDVDLSLVEPDLLVEFKTASGDLESEIPSRVERENRKEFKVSLGSARGHVVVKTVSGDLNVRGTVMDVPGEPTNEQPAPRSEYASSYRSDEDEPGETEAMPMGAPAAPVPPPVDPQAREELRGLLEKLAKGEVSLDDAAAALDARKRNG